MATTAASIPLRLRIGVTGHRTLADERALGESVDVVISHLRSRAPSTPTTPIVFEVVSPLGEGADRLVAARVLRDATATLEVPLPLPAEDYETDFLSNDSRLRFRELATRADSVWVVGGGGRADAYTRVGAYLVDSCDVLIAIWDGRPARGPGGTADILGLAEKQGMPTFVISAEPPFVIREELVPIEFSLIDGADRYNQMSLRAQRGGSIPPPKPSQHATDEGARALEPYVSWAEPWYGPADSLANLYRNRFIWASRLLFLLSASAVLAVAISATAESIGPRRAFAAAEAALMCVTVALWLRVRRRLHDRWITTRFFTERLRSAVFLAFVGSESLAEPTPQGTYRSTSQEWLTRFFREIWRSRPRDRGSGAALEIAKAALRDAWIDRQIEYYDDRGRRHATSYVVLTVMSATLFATAIGAAILDASGAVSETEWSRTVVVLSIALPAFAAALIGIAALEQHARHAERFRLIARRLKELAERLERADDLELVADIAIRVDAELRTEAAAWIDVMRFQDVELPV
jgi:hypothetical protein